MLALNAPLPIAVASIDVTAASRASDPTAVLLPGAFYFLRETRLLVDHCLKIKAISGIDAPVLFDMLRDWTHKLIYQAINARQLTPSTRFITSSGLPCASLPESSGLT